MSNPLDKYKELFGVEELDMKIEDGAMIIRPSDVGVILLSMIELGNQDNENLITMVEELRKEYDKKVSEISEYKNFLEDLVESLNSVDSLSKEECFKIENDILNFMYPVYGIDAEGNSYKLTEDLNGQ